MDREHISKHEWSEWRRKLLQGAPLFDSSQFTSRELSLMFGEFSKISGIVLDVGSGPRKAPYLESARCESCVGLDPLPIKESNFDLVCGVGEFLPFKSKAFDQCLCGTSLDHCVRPELALKEMRRTTKEEGRISLWIGTFDRPKGDVSRMSLLSQETRDGWTVLKRRDFRFLARAIRVRLARLATKVTSRVRSILGLISDPYHLHHFRDKDVDRLLERLRLSILERKKLLDGSLFITVR